jgi:hypothetical protein
MKYCILVLTVAVLFLMACNSMRRIRMENRSDEEATISWVIKEDSLHQSKLFMSSSDTVRFTLQPKRPYNKIKMSVGTGNWRPKELSDFVDDLECLEIKWKGGTIKLDTTAIYDYLVIRRKGMDNSQIKIEVK